MSARRHADADVLLLLRDKTAAREGDNTMRTATWTRIDKDGSAIDKARMILPVTTFQAKDTADPWLKPGYQYWQDEHGCIFFTPNNGDGLWTVIE